MPEWRSSETLAWSSHDGPRRPPAGTNPAAGAVLAAVLGVVFTVIVFTDQLCPEHRLWVQSLAIAALAGTVVGGISLVRGWAAGPFLTVLAATAGVAIGIIDMAHDPGRGVLVTTGFGVALLGAIWMCIQQVRCRRWERRELSVQTTSEPVPRGSADETPSEPVSRTADSIR